VVHESQNAELLPAVALGLGALGILVEVTLQCVPAFLLHAVERREVLGEVLGSLDERIAASDHFEFYWFPHTGKAMTITNTRLPESAVRHPRPPLRKWVDDVALGSVTHEVACRLGHVAPALSPALNRLSVVLWSNRDFTDVASRVFATYRPVRFREMEYALPVENVRSAFEAVRTLIDDRGWRIGFPIEVRFAAQDDLWLSTGHGRASGYIAVHR
jgi:FAD/FMN-containing dehydrogenase